MIKQAAAVFASGMFAAMTLPAMAQDAPVQLTRGAITSVTANAIDAKSRNGQALVIGLRDDTKVLGATRSSLADVMPNSYVGIAAAPQPDGTLKALEVTIIDEKLRGMGDGHYGWDLTGGNTMTNGAVGSVQTTNGRSMVINYKGGSKTVTVADGVPVVKIAPADRKLLTPGARIVVFSKKGVTPVSADAVVAGENGAVPPM